MKEVRIPGGVYIQSIRDNAFKLSDQLAHLRDYYFSNPPVDPYDDEKTRALLDTCCRLMAQAQGIRDQYEALAKEQKEEREKK